ncbi:hypothetical protein V2I01_42890 [Micromonospora sp. BRA006-A]|nr:hypothetical protein [Micromonospora sp. BRA006-A]
MEIVFNPDVYGEALITDVLSDVERLLRAGAADPSGRWPSCPPGPPSRPERPTTCPGPPG